MQDSLFSFDAEEPAPRPAPSGAAARTRAQAAIAAQAPDPAHQALAAELPSLLRLGTSSWNYPGWTGMVWADEHPEAALSKRGLPAYSQHPLFRSVCVDRAFYRPLTASQYAAYAAQVPPDFRFVVKAPGLVTDAMVRGEDGRGLQANPAFLDPQLALQEFVAPALEGLGARLGALVFQLSPLPGPMLGRLPQILERLRAMLQALPALRPHAPDGVMAVEVRNPEWITPELAQALRETGATYCLGLHAKMPRIGEQLPMLRALWPGPLVCRWNLHPVHGLYGYEDAKQLYEPFDRLHDVDEETREALAKVAIATTRAGHPAYITVSNKAEGCAPLSIAGLAQTIRTRMRQTA
ncbi:DUF72 domain-containing protein [Xylophilus sp. ASV27]|uniref:DUF72 domain-containing protein n=1 Tax=Xylophilus sp. ASV27 TaxID=2795129 RepID=UPI0018EC5089|nr:DUF72 domain-containing protein [Xylophilus sp. ASV27]